MNVKSWAFAALAASVVLGATGCTDSSPAAQATRTPIPSAVPSTPAATQAPTPGEGNPPADPPKAQPSPVTAAPAPAPNNPPAPDNPPPVADPPAADQPPNGSGHGLCFDSNSDLARSAVARLAPNKEGYPWVIREASNDPISAGCAGVLSWMLVDWNGSHPGYHVLFFTNGTYLGTATSKYYGYTTVLGKTKNTVSVQYRWVTPQDALCCPSGGPNVVTYTLTGTTVQAKGEFPPDPDK
ncbi:LppP/LprE family lipoprotein [Nocardia brasiliensis]|uniref:LppP/LprE family lipoprotein n=1 Tax=Nocardia brasiliensis TaxID=37326 RepID=UPI001E5ABA22|nr:LppP/LprE family lipoprotein [Nocardia brasiliensis]